LNSLQGYKIIGSLPCQERHRDNVDCQPLVEL